MIFIESKEKGLEEPLLFVSDGLPGLVPAIKEAYPGAKFQLCISHIVKNKFIKSKEKR